MLPFHRLTDRIFYLPFSEETDRPNLGYIQGDRFSLMVDAGNSAKHAGLFLSCLAEQGLPAPEYNAITHWHWDHTFGMHALSAKSIAGRLTNRQLGTMAQWKWDDLSMSRRLASGEEIEFCDTHIRIEYPNRDEITVKTADLVFDRSLSLDLGGITCELFHIGGPHSEDSVAVYIPEEKIIFLGDSACGDFYHNQGHYDYRQLSDYIKLLHKIDFTICVEGHDMDMSKELFMKSMEEELDKFSS